MIHLRSLCIVPLAFAVAVAGIRQTDQLEVDPTTPTAADPITFTIVIPDWDCCTQYFHDSTTVSVIGTIILLAYQSFFPQICPMIYCEGVEYRLNYRSAPLAAGTYAVYESVDGLCGDEPCPQAPIGPSLLNRLGEITVLPATGIADEAPLATRRPAAPHVPGVFTLRGEILPGSSSGRTVAPGVYMVTDHMGRAQKTIR